MSISILFSDSVNPSILQGIRTGLKAIRLKGVDPWEVHIATEKDWLTLSIHGPDYHRRVFRVPGDHSSDPLYLAALVRAEIHSFPSSPARDVALAVAELAHLGIPYDDTKIFNGRITVNGRDYTVDTLADLYRRHDLEARFVRTAD